MKQTKCPWGIKVFIATLVLTCFAYFPAPVFADGLDDLDVTMEVLDDVAGIDDAILEMRGPEGDGDDLGDDSGDESSGHEKDGEGDSGEDAFGEEQGEFEEHEDDFEDDDDFDEEDLDEEDDFEEEEGEDVDV